jgi:hypothetical protein
MKRVVIHGPSVGVVTMVGADGPDGVARSCSQKAFNIDVADAMSLAVVQARETMDERAEIA